MLHLIKSIIGTVSYGPTPGEQSNLKFRRSLFAIKDIKKGDVIMEESIRSIRPSMGLKPKYYKELLGKVAVCDVAYGTPLEVEMFE